MKPFPINALAAFVLAALPLAAETPTATDDPFMDPGPQGAEGPVLPSLVRVQVEFIEVAHEDLTALMDSDAAMSDTRLRRKVGELVEAKQATIYETLMVVTRPGQKATSESIEEFIYPTEYEPSEIPVEIHTTGKGDKVKSDGRDYATGPTPTAFETRNTGATLEVEPNLGMDAGVIDLRLQPEVVFHVRNEVWAEWTGKHGASPIQMPIFYAMRFSTSITIMDGGYASVAALSPKGPDGFPDFGKKLMVFARADVVSIAP